MSRALQAVDGLSMINRGRRYQSFQRVFERFSLGYSLFPTRR